MGDKAYYHYTLPWVLYYGGKLQLSAWNWHFNELLSDNLVVLRGDFFRFWCPNTAQAETMSCRSIWFCFTLSDICCVFLDANHIFVVFLQIYPDPELESEIMSSMIRCIHYKEGCKWVDKLQTLQVSFTQVSWPWPNYTCWHDLLLSNLDPVITIIVTYISVILTQLWLLSWPTVMWSWPSYALCHNLFFVTLTQPYL